MALVKSGLFRHKDCDIVTVDLLTKCTQHERAGQRGSPHTVGQSETTRDFITLLSTVYNLKLMNFLFLNFTWNIFRLLLIMGNWNWGKCNMDEGVSCICSHINKTLFLLKILCDPVNLNQKYGFQESHFPTRFSFILEFIKQSLKAWKNL